MADIDAQPAYLFRKTLRIIATKVYIPDVRKIGTLKTAIPGSLAKIQVLDVHEIALIQSTQGSPLFAPYQQKGSLHPINFMRVIVAELPRRCEHAAQKYQP